MATKIPQCQIWMHNRLNQQYNASGSQKCLELQSLATHPSRMPSFSMSPPSLQVWSSWSLTKIWTFMPPAVHTICFFFPCRMAWQWRGRLCRYPSCPLKGHLPSYLLLLQMSICSDWSTKKFTSIHIYSVTLKLFKIISWIFSPWNILKCKISHLLNLNSTSTPENVKHILLT